MTLDPDAERRIAERVASGGYASPEAVVTAALDALGEKEEHERQLAELRRELDSGDADIEAGRVRKLTEQDWLDMVDRVAADEERRRKLADLRREVDIGLRELAEGKKAPFDAKATLAAIRDGRRAAGGGEG